ncbi:hypothetical protein HN51_035490, partial [Arachis hypogaea]
KEEDKRRRLKIDPVKPCITILVNDAKKSSDIDSEEVKQTLEIVEVNLSKTKGKRQLIEANLSLQ